MTAPALKTEFETYRENFSKLLADHEGQHVVISGRRILGVYDTYADGIQVGYDRVGLAPFMVQRIVRPELATGRFSRPIHPA
jgi:hypothetical protein